MLKISRLTDYGLLAAVYLARRGGTVVSSREIAAFYHLPVPMITKVLKTLQQGALVQSHRGVGGGVRSRVRGGGGCVGVVVTTVVGTGCGGGGT